MFKITRANSVPLGASGQPHPGLPHHQFLEQFCVSESWSGDLSTGLFRLGEKAAAIHGLRDGECGLLNFVRCYDTADRNHVLELFEQAATTCSSFCFSTTIALEEAGQKQPLFCIGESSGLEQRYSGTITGVFFFPRFLVDGVGPAMLRQ